MYSIDWAREVVKRHYQKHARAAFFLLGKGPFSSLSLAIWVARRDPKWELFKKAVVILEQYTNDDPEPSKYYTPVSVNGFSAYEQIVENLAHTPYAGVFTAIGVYPNIKKQSLKARAAPPDEVGAKIDARQGDLSF